MRADNKVVSLNITWKLSQLYYQLTIALYSIHDIHCVSITSCGCLVRWSCGCSLLVLMAVESNMNEKYIPIMQA